MAHIMELSSTKWKSDAVLQVDCKSNGHSIVRMRPEVCCTAYMSRKDITHPAQLITPPTSHKTRLTPLLPVIASTVGGATNTPVPTILFNISALHHHSPRQVIKGLQNAGGGALPGREISKVIPGPHQFQLPVAIKVKNFMWVSLCLVWLQHSKSIILKCVKLDLMVGCRPPYIISLRTNDGG